jgi:hypothetical protein
MPQCTPTQQNHKNFKNKNKKIKHTHIGTNINLPGKKGIAGCRLREWEDQTPRNIKSTRYAQ